jgi:hypothetical protein
VPPRQGDVRPLQNPLGQQLLTIPSEFYEAARVDGAGTRRRLAVEDLPASGLQLA